MAKIPTRKINRNLTRAAKLVGRKSKAIYPGGWVGNLWAVLYLKSKKRRLVNSEESAEQNVVLGPDTLWDDEFNVLTDDLGDNILSPSTVFFFINNDAMQFRNGDYAEVR